MGVGPYYICEELPFFKQYFHKGGLVKASLGITQSKSTVASYHFLS